jgi:hypothetical protein
MMATKCRIRIVQKWWRQQQGTYLMDRSMLDSFARQLLISTLLTPNKFAPIPADVSSQLICSFECARFESDFKAL